MFVCRSCPGAQLPRVRTHGGLTPGLALDITDVDITTRGFKALPENEHEADAIRNAGALWIAAAR